MKTRYAGSKVYHVQGLDPLHGLMIICLLLIKGRFNQLAFHLDIAFCFILEGGLFSFSRLFACC